MTISNKAVACVFSLLVCPLTVYAQDSGGTLASDDNAVDSSKARAVVSRQFVEFAYDDAEAGFNGLHIAGLYNYNDDYSLSLETAMLRGHSINYKHAFVGVQKYYNAFGKLKWPLVPVARAGILYSSFDSDSEYGLLLGARLKAPIRNKLIIETGVDWHSGGENSLVWNVRSSYDLTDSLYVHVAYWRGSLDELTLGIGTSF